VSKDPGRTSPENTVVTVVSKPAAPPSPKGACLVVIVGEEIGKRIPLGHDELTIGRASTSVLQLDIDNVSRHHAAVVMTTIGFVLKDLGSTNGTFVNDHRVDEHRLRDGDQIRIGRAILKFLTSGNVEAQYHEEIYRLMTLDGLTQIHNKRYFTDTLEKELARSKRYKHPFTLVLFDIDHFKKVNDTHGHLAGDEVLRRVAQVVKVNVRTNDTVARVGGEEFALLLPEVGVDGGVVLAEKLRRLVESERCVHDGVHIPVTISLGVAEWSKAFESAEAMLSAADTKLYEAKRGGRNRVCR
jgi:diguanylate cyclase (GGDEF)-like protein